MGHPDLYGISDELDRELESTDRMSLFCYSTTSFVVLMIVLGQIIVPLLSG